MCNKIGHKLKSFVLILVGIGVDQVSKYFALQNLERGFPIAVLPNLNWSLNYNRGISFGLFNQQSTIVPLILILIVLALIIGLLVWLWKLPQKESWQAFSLSLIMGGAIGNLIDRIYLGHVVDFIDFYIGEWHWYTFNMADSLICIGTALLAIYLFKVERLERLST